MGTNTRREHWIDLLRGCCMLAILLFHTESYVAGEALIPYYLYIGDALVIFFYLSGYLIFRSEGFSLRHKMRSILHRLVIPYLAFTTLMAIPKALAHGMTLSSNTMQLLVESIVLGQASWFVAALIVAELIFALILRVSRENIWAVVLTAVLGLPTSLFVSHHVGECCVWQLNQALLVLSYLALGYGIHRMKNNLSIQREWNRTNQGRDFLFPFRFYSLPNGVRKQLCSSLKATMLIVALAALMIIKGLERKSGGNFILCPLQISDGALFTADSLFAIFLTSEVCQGLERLRLHKDTAFNSLEAITRRLLWLLEHTGRQSLVYYFFCGGIPLLVSRALPHIGLFYDGNYGIILLAFALVYLITGILANLCYRLCPQLVGNKSRKATT